MKVRRIFGKIESAAKGLRFPFRNASIGAIVTALTMFSHADTLISLSSFTRNVMRYWRELIALPWTLLLSLFGISIPITLAGMATVLLATGFVVRSAWRETGVLMTLKTRTTGIAVCCAVGVLYSVLIIIPALYHSDDAMLTSFSMALEFLAEIFYTDVPTVSEPSYLHIAIGWLTLISLYAAFMFWHFWRKTSVKSKTRFRLGLVVTILFAIFLLNYVYIGFDPFNPLVDDALNHIGGSILIFIVAVVLLFGPFVASVYMADPQSSMQRNAAILAVLFALFIVDRVALAIDAVAKAVTGAAGVN